MGSLLISLYPKGLQSIFNILSFLILKNDALCIECINPKFLNYKWILPIMILTFSFIICLLVNETLIKRTEKISYYMMMYSLLLYYYIPINQNLYHNIQCTNSNGVQCIS